MDQPKPLARTPENIEKVTNEMLEEGFLMNTLEQKRIFEEILEGRLKGYRPDNCPHPSYVLSGPYSLCTQCGYQDPL